MIPKDKGGGCQTLDYGGKSMCYHPVWFAHVPLSHPTTLMICWVVEAVMAGSGVWQDCQFFPTCTLHQQVDLTLERKPPLPFYQWGHSLHWGFTLMQGHIGGGRLTFLTHGVGVFASTIAGLWRIVVVLFCCQWIVVFHICWPRPFPSRKDGLRIGSFPILVCATFFSDCIEELCAVCSWMLDNC